MLKVQYRGKTLRLKWLTDQEYHKAEQLARASGLPLSKCPTCLTPAGDVPANAADEPDLFKRTYRFRGEEHFCDCDAQIALRARYLVANIPDEYVRLDWDDYNGPERVREAVELYLGRVEYFRLNGMGVEIGGPLGVGKTFAATHIAKELVKLGQKVYYMPFLDVISAYQRHDAEDFDQFLRSTTYLVLDELLPPYSSAQHDLYAHRLEALIRHRTNFNLPTILTTNLTQSALDGHYPRTFSLLKAKQMRIDLTGEDARRNWIQEENMALVANGEVRPIT